MAKYEMLIAASGKRGSALLPCVVVDEKGVKRAAVRAKAMARACYPEYEKFNEVGGFPFDVRRSPTIDLGYPNLFRPKIEGDAVVLPASWRDDEDDN